MRHFLLCLAATLAAALLSAPEGAAQQVVGFATNPQGTLGFSTGTAVAKVVTEKSGGIVGRVEPRGGSTAYIPIINRGEIEFGFANALELQYAFTGTGTFAGKVNQNIRLVGVMYPLRTGLAVVADAGVKTIHELHKLKGKRIASEFATLTIIATYIEGALANGNLSYNDFRKVPVSDFSKGMSALGEGTVDITLISVGAGDAQKVNAELRSRGGFRYVDLDDSPEPLARFNKVMPGAEIVRIEPSPALPGVHEPTRIVQIAYILLTHEKAADELVYRAAKALADNKADLVAALPVFNGFNRARMAPKHVVAYHPGALKFYREAGIAAP